MLKKPQAVAKLPLCEITDVFWSEAENELIEYVTDSPVMQRASTGHVSCTLKSESAPRPEVIGKCDLRVTTSVTHRGTQLGRRRQVALFPGATITEITNDYPGEWVTHFWTYNRPAPTVADAGRKGGKARAAKLTKAERSAIARKAAHGRWKKP